MIKPGTLYIVATPIGNLNDISFRAKDVLAGVELVACEDTRVTGKLLQHLGLDKKLTSIHQHSLDKDLRAILERLMDGDDVAYVSDAGTPAISDPGGKLVQFVLKERVDVVPIPGASAALAALQVSGLPADEFTFLGFPPHKKGRSSFFTALNDITHTIVLFESKHRILKALEQLPEDRYIVVGRELTKMHETFYRGLPQQVKKELEETSTKGEFVIVISPKNWKQ